MNLPPPTPARSTAPLPGPSASTAQMTALTIALSLLFTEPREPAPLIPTDEDKEDEEEEQEMLLSKESITDLATAIVLALQAAGEGTSQGSKLNKVHVAKPRDFDGEHGYVDFKQELCLYVYALESEFRNSKVKIMFALSYMKSSVAASWAESYTSGVIDEHGRIAFKDTWDAFLKKLNTLFDNPAHSQKAFERLDAMYQGNLNADEFFNKFNICRVDAGLATEAHDKWLMSHIKRALNLKVVEGIMHLPNEPTTYEEFKKATVKVNRIKCQIRDLMAKHRRKTISSTVMKPTPPPLKRPVPPQQATCPFVPPAQDCHNATGVMYGGLGQPMDMMINQAHRTRTCYKCGQVGHYIQECPWGREAICAIIVAFVPEDREALLKELSQAKESSFSDVNVQVVPTELENS